MNPFPIIAASLRRHAVMNILFILLIAIAVAIGVGITAQEGALRQGSAHAADKFDILVAAPGSHTEIVMNTIFLQPSAVELLDGQYWGPLTTDKRIDIAAPLAFGDSRQGHSIVGSTANFIDYLSGGLAAGTMFDHIDEAIIGAAVPMSINDEFEPSHGHGPEEALEHHHGIELRVTGRMKPTGTPWDSAIIVPVEQVWEIHGLPSGHHEIEHEHVHDDDHAVSHETSKEMAISHTDNEDEDRDHDHEENGEHHHEHHALTMPDHLGPPYDLDELPGVPALVVHPTNLTAAYSIRSDYRTEHSTAFFPAEVLVEMYRMLGNASSVMRAMALGSQALVVAAILAAILALMQLYRKQFAVLRAFGAPKAYIFVAIWGYVSILVIIGAALGLGAGWFIAQLVSRIFTAQTGMAMQATLGLSEWGLAGGFVIIGLILATIPALLLYRKPVVDALRAG